jgi:hypothetical protein
MSDTMIHKVMSVAMVMQFRIAVSMEKLSFSSYTSSKNLQGQIE